MFGMKLLVHSQRCLEMGIQSLIHAGIKNNNILVKGTTVAPFTDTDELQPQHG